MVLTPRRVVPALLAALLALLVPGRTARADAGQEFWPEASAFLRLSPQTRLYFDAAYAQGKESSSRTLDVAGYVDISLKPILRPVLRQEDWARNRYVWTRIGYDHVLKGEAGIPSPSENRGIVSLYGKLAVPGEIWLEGRARTDFRWISGDYSTRYRLRIEATREFMVSGHPVTPYFNVEWFYDTRYDGWSRTLYQLGPEVTVDKTFRFELYVARQVDKLPDPLALNAFGIVAKLYY